MWLLAAFVLVPLIEIGLFIRVGGWIGLWPTLALVLAMALLGSWLLRTQGASAFADLRRSMSGSGDPTEPVAHGALILFAGMLLLTPGFFTDLMGLALLIRPVRSLIISHLSRRLTMTVFGSARPASRPSDSEVIEAEYRDLGSSPGPTPPSGWTRH